MVKANGAYYVFGRYAGHICGIPLDDGLDLEFSEPRKIDLSFLRNDEHIR